MRDLLIVMGKAVTDGYIHPKGIAITIFGKLGDEISDIKNKL